MQVEQENRQSWTYNPYNVRNIYYIYHGFAKKNVLKVIIATRHCNCNNSWSV